MYYELIFWGKYANNMHFSADLIPDSAPSKICRHFPIPSKVHRRPRAGRILSVTGPRAANFLKDTTPSPQVLSDSHDSAVVRLPQPRSPDP